MSREMRSIHPESSLHEIKDLIQLRYAEQQAESIADNLDGLLEMTWKAAPVRAPEHCYPFLRALAVRKLTRSSKSRDRWMEKHWEEACFRKWRLSDEGLDAGLPFTRIAAYQVMLREDNTNKNWGEIDLLGVGQSQLPVVIELKSKPSEYLLRAIVEAVAYGVVVRKAWAASASRFRKDWANACPSADALPCELTTCPLAVAAPTEYWNSCLNTGAPPVRFRTPQKAIDAIRKLLNDLRTRGYPVSLVEITHEGCGDDHGLPLITEARCRVLP